MFIVDDLFMSPLRFLLFVAREIYKHAEAELTDEQAIARQLLEAQHLLDSGEIDQEEYGRIEEKLLDRLRLAREIKASRAEEEAEEE
ncbi:hypothetical membrane protein [Pelotomaculum thermopropionicum SI]|uniref:Hypothetical membrane protein n=1 Tax=Pelotomaculum thermopropionicum (strain DSM 13744 / JCM 10971 / SI) TaxID=370438 RepID=A5D583_PELTS|nr:hypothetical membrane protein [Pelotomaculum thermopropionicum SI]